MPQKHRDTSGLPGEPVGDGVDAGDTRQRMHCGVDDQHLVHRQMLPLSSVKRHPSSRPSVLSYHDLSEAGEMKM